MIIILHIFAVMFIFILGFAVCSILVAGNRADDKLEKMKNNSKKEDVV